jgi:dihydroflavonol-4-reductase
MSRFLVTGATGFLGRHLVTLLKGEGHEVVALCRAASDPAFEAQGVTVAPGDVLDAASVRAAAAGCEALFHCAGKVSRRPEDAEELYKVHVEGTKVTLDACRAAGVSRVVLASTSGVVAVSRGGGAREPRPIAEAAETPMEILARFPYYRSKLFAERAALDRSGPGFEVVSVNPSLLLGPGDDRGSSTGDVVTFLERKVPFVPAGGVSFVDARDAAKAMSLAYARGRAGQRYLLSAANLTMEAFFAKLERVSGVQGPRLKLPRGTAIARAGAGLLERASKLLPVEVSVDPVSAEMAQLFWYVDASRARDELGFSPRDPTDTLSDTVRDLLDRGVIWP